jgi:hypothetical protein
LGKHSLFIARTILEHCEEHMASITVVPQCWQSKLVHFCKIIYPNGGEYVHY